MMKRKARGSDNEIETALAQLILDWKLDEAAALLSDPELSISPIGLSMLNNLLDQYREWDGIVKKSKAQLFSNPEESSFAYLQIPENVRITHPLSKTLEKGISESSGQWRIAEAEKKCEEARNYLLNDLDTSKAETSLLSAKEICPEWENRSDLRIRIERLSNLNIRLAKGLSIQKDISVLNEKGGEFSSRQAMTLLNEYAALGLESEGIKLFDINEEREKFLKASIRSEGKSWNYRMSPSSKEVLRLEQSIRSLESAENKNLRALYNNNAKLITRLSLDLEQIPDQTEESILILARIEELRNNNQIIETSVHEEAAKRAKEYCDLAEKALQAAELSAAHSNCHLAENAGKVNSEYQDEDFLGEVFLPTDVLDRIDQLSARIARSLKTREGLEKKFSEIRETFHSTNNISLNSLYLWISEINNLKAQDPGIPGLEQFETELSKRFTSLKAYTFERLIFEIDRNLRKENTEAAKKLLDNIDLYYTSETEREAVNAQMEKIGKTEDTLHKIREIMKEIDDLMEESMAKLICEPSIIQRITSLFDRIGEIYQNNQVLDNQKFENEKERKRQLLNAIIQSQAEIEIIRDALAHQQFTDDVCGVAERFQFSKAGSLPSARDLLARFWMTKAISDNQANPEMDFAKAEQIASESGNSDLYIEVKKHRETFNNQYELGRKINLTLEALQEFYNRNDFVVATEFIAKKVSPDMQNIPLIAIMIEKIEIAYRKEQSAALFENATQCLNQGQLDEAEESANQALNLWYSIENAQLVKTIESRIANGRALSAEFDLFLAKDFYNLESLSEMDVENIRLIQEKVERLEKNPIINQSLNTKAAAVNKRIASLRNNEKNDFDYLEQTFGNFILNGDNGLQQAAGLLKSMEQRSWIGSYSLQVMELQLRLKQITNVANSLNMMINQAYGFSHQGDFQSARRILDSFSSENLLICPEWILIRKSAAINHLSEMETKYNQVKEAFDGTNQKTGPIISRTIALLLSDSVDLDSSFNLLTDLEKNKAILEKEINVVAENNPYVRSINHLANVIRWAEMISEFQYGVDLPQENISMEPLYAMRKTGRELMERLPPALIEIQSALAEKNKWLETRSKVRQSFLNINSILTSKKGLIGGSRDLINAELNALSPYALIASEKKEIKNIYAILNREKSKQKRLLGVILFFVLLLAALYYFLPWILPLVIRPEQGTVSIENQVVMQASFTDSPEASGVIQTPISAEEGRENLNLSTPTAMPPIILYTPTPSGLIGKIENRLIGVYELPRGNSKLLSNGYLPVGQEVKIIRYCESSYRKGEYWALIFYRSETRPTGWVRIREAESFDYISLSDNGKPAKSILEENPRLKIKCPEETYDEIPGS